VWVRTRIHGVYVCTLLYLCVSSNANTWSMCLCIVVSLCELELEYMEYVFVHGCFFVLAITRIHSRLICVYILLFHLLNQNQNTWSKCLCTVVSLCELEREYMEYVFVYYCFCVWFRTRIHGAKACSFPRF
jgi:hypothetical protein